MYHSPNEGNLRALLDQRAARANIPSASLFDESYDTPSPSIYSHPGAFSPRSHNNHLPTLGSPLQSPTRSYLSSDRERLNNPALSSLDLDDEPRNSYVSDSTDQFDLSADASTEEDDGMSRMSLLGPKMRIHSPAPWELEDSPILEEAEPTSSYLSAARNGVKKLGFSGVSPRSSSSSRPSNESTRSQPSSKRSFDAPSFTSTRHGGPSQLRTTTPTPLQSSTVDSAFTPSVRQQSTYTTHSSSSHPSLLPAGSLASPYGKETRSSSRYRSTSLDEVEDHSVVRDSTAWPLGRYEEDTHRHPYANADAYFLDSSPAPTSRGSSDLQPMGISRSDSSLTITESSTVSSTATKISPDSSLVGIRQKHTTAFHGKEISLPMSLSPEAAHRSPGWPERSLSPSVNLISLEEAQQQAKRSRSATVDGKPTLMYQPSPSKPLAFPYPEGETSSFMESSPSARQRSRSISAGVRANAKNVLGNMKVAPTPKIERRDSEPAVVSAPGGGKSLKHKKSGFMRIFNSRDKDKDEVPPPVPSISGTFAASLHQPAPESALMHKPTSTSRRVPVPSIGLLLDEYGDASVQDDVFSTQASSSQRPIPPSPSAKKTPPLSIDTSRTPTTNPRHDQDVRSVPSSAVMKDASWQGLVVPPQSAPPGVTEFGATASAQMPSLRLRPVSTTFSSQFGDKYMTKPSLTPALEEDFDLTSPTSTLSPITPGLHPRMNTEAKDTVDSSDQQDQSSLVHALQEQIVSAKLAWQRQIWELEGQVRDLKAEVEEARSQLAVGSSLNTDFCEACGRGIPVPARDDILPTPGKPTSVLNRPRARTGGAHRFVSS